MSQPDWIEDAITQTDQQFAPQPVDWNAARERRSNPAAESESVKAAVQDHAAMSSADGLAALDALDAAHAEREAERLARLNP